MSRARSIGVAALAVGVLIGGASCGRGSAPSQGGGTPAHYEVSALDASGTVHATVRYRDASGSMRAATETLPWSSPDFRVSSRDHLTLHVSANGANLQCVVVVAEGPYGRQHASTGDGQCDIDTTPAALAQR